MKITLTAKQLIHTHLEEALLRYRDYRAGKFVASALRVYLDILAERDVVGAYVCGISKTSRRGEHRAVKLFLEGNRLAEVARELRKDGIGFEDVKLWIYGSEAKDGLVSAVYAEFLKMSQYCPFCDDAGGQSKGGSYPLTGKTCPHRELEEEE